MKSAHVRPSPAQLKLLVEADSGSVIVLTDSGCRWYKGQGNARAGKPRRATVLAATRMGWMQCIDELRGHWGISEAGSAIKAMALSEGMEPTEPTSKLGLHVPDLIRALEKRHPFPQWVLAPEVMIDDGLGIRYIDLLAVSLRWTVSYELKLTRQDFLKEIAQPEKSIYAREIASQFYFCAPAGIISVDELPDGAGLVEVFHNGNFTIRRKAQSSGRPPPDWELVTRIMRAVHRAK